MRYGVYLLQTGIPHPFWILDERMEKALKQQSEQMGTVIAWVRHGETEWNRLRKIQGQTDIPLNETGKQQAALAADRLVHETWDGIYASDLARARQTAEIISDRLGVKILGLDARLRERGFGSLEGTLYGTRNVEWAAKDGRNGAGASDVESESAIVERGLGFVNELTTRMAGKKVIVVSHGGFIRRLLAVLTGVRLEPLPNASINIIRQVKPDRWELISREDGIQTGS